MSSFNLNVDSESLKSLPSTPKEALQAIQQFFKNLSGGIERASITFNTSSANLAKASATVTCANASVDDTVTIGSVVLTAKASPANEAQFSQAGNDTADAASLAAVINAHSVLGKSFSATSALGVVTIVPKVPGSITNHIAISSSNGTRLAVTAFAGGLGGSESTEQVIRAGI